MMIYFGWVHIFVGLAALGIALTVLWMKGRSFSYLPFFSIFWIYLMSVARLIAFPFPMGYSNPDFKPSLNLIPLKFGDCSYLILCIRNIYWLALAVGLALEIIQLAISLVVRSHFRVVDLNDVLLNALGVLLGYGIFRISACYILLLFKNRKSKNHISSLIFMI